MGALALATAAGLLGPLFAAGRRGLVPVVVGELLAGVLLGHTGTGWLDPGQVPLPSLRGLGFALLMLTAGTHVDLASPAIRRGAAGGLSSAVLTAALAVPAGLLLARTTGGRGALLVVLIAGSSAAVAYPILEERSAPLARTARLLAWVAIADTVTVVVMPLALSAGHDLSGALLGDLAIVAIAGVLMVAAPRLARSRASARARELSVRRHWALQLRLSLVLLLVLSTVADRSGGSALVAGFAAGMVLVRLREPDRLALQLTGLADGFLVPLFFVLLGASLDLRALVHSPSALALTAGLAATVVVVHVVAALVTVPRDRLATGLSASAQLGLPAAAASLGLSTGALDPAGAAALVAAACVTLVPATIGARMLSTMAPAAPPGQPVAASRAGSGR